MGGEPGGGWEVEADNTSRVGVVGFELRHEGRFAKDGQERLGRATLRAPRVPPGECAAARVHQLVTYLESFHGALLSQGHCRGDSFGTERYAR